MVTTKKTLQEEIDRLRHEYAELDFKYTACKRDLEMYIEKNGLVEAEADRYRIAYIEEKKICSEAKNLAAERKHELDALSDTKTVLANLKSMLSNPHNDYQKVVDELNSMLVAERNRAERFERELETQQFYVQENNYLRGKVEAYEAVIIKKED